MESPAERVEIGDETFVIDDKHAGELAFEPADQEELDKLTEAAVELDTPSETLREELEALTFGMPVIDARKERIRLLNALVRKAKHGGYELKLCKYEKCKRGPSGGPALVRPPTRNGIFLKNVQKDFCCPDCSNAHFRDRYWKRKRGKHNWFLDLGGPNKVARFERVKPRSVEVAQARYVSHRRDQKCPSGETPGRCPSVINNIFLTKAQWEKSFLPRGDTNRYPGRCLILAVFADDLIELSWRRAGKVGYPRKWTTNDGRWLEDSEEADLRSDPTLQAGGYMSN